ncbi:MAG: DUF4384 domain-containing protein [Lentisphaeria bacterium]|nr:DUF4384 domain-containing protein [Lentisphaeria bacterium]
MLFIKKIETAADFEFVKQQDPHAEDHIWVLVNNYESGKSFFAPMVPRDEAELKKKMFFFKDKNETVWKGGYYISPRAFDLTFDGTLRHQDSPKPLLTTLGVKVTGLDVNKDMTELISWLAGKTELHTEEIDAKLADRKKEFFASLERELYQPEKYNEVSSSQNVNMQILALAKDCMLKAFPWMNVEITFADTEAILSESEKEFKKYCDELADSQRRMALELQQKQAEMSYRISLQEMEQSEKDAAFAANMREQDCHLAAEQKKLALRIQKESADEEVQKEIDKIRAEREEIWMALRQKKALMALEIKERELAIEADADARAKNMEILEIQKQKELYELEVLKNKVAFSKEYRTRKLQAVEQGMAFNASAQAALEENFKKREEELVKIIDDLKNQLTATVGDIQTRRTEAARVISNQKRIHPIALKRENTFTSRAISLVGTIEMKAVKVGENISFKFRSPVTGYFHLFCSESGGGFAVLVPNAYDQQIFVEAGKEYEFPASKSVLYGKVTQDGPAGFESVYGIVSPAPLTHIPTGLTADEIRLLPGEVDQITRTLKELPSDSWAADTISYEIKF